VSTLYQILRELYTNIHGTSPSSWDSAALRSVVGITKLSVVQIVWSCARLSLYGAKLDARSDAATFLTCFLTLEI
jgi:hypothetical protein